MKELIKEYWIPVAVLVLSPVLLALFTFIFAITFTILCSLFGIQVK